MSQKLVYFYGNCHTKVFTIMKIDVIIGHSETGWRRNFESSGEHY